MRVMIANNYLTSTISTLSGGTVDRENSVAYHNR